MHGLSHHVWPVPCRDGIFIAQRYRNARATPRNPDGQDIRLRAKIGYQNRKTFREISHSNPDLSESRPQNIISMRRIAHPEPHRDIDGLVRRPVLPDKRPPAIGAITGAENPRGRSRMVRAVMPDPDTAPEHIRGVGLRRSGQYGADCQWGQSRRDPCLVDQRDNPRPIAGIRRSPTGRGQKGQYACKENKRSFQSVNRKDSNTQ